MSPLVRKKRKRFSIPSKYILLLLTGLCVLTMVVTFSTDISLGFTNSVVGKMIVPFQSGISEVGTWITERSDELVQIKDLIKENKLLEEEVAELTIQNTLLQQDKYELSNLRELYELDEQYAQYEKVGARIIANETGNWFHYFTIDKGLEDGLKVDMNVIAGSGLAGRIVEIGDNWSKVMAIINDNSNVSGEVLATSDRLIVSGDLSLMEEGTIHFQQLLDTEEKVVKGDKIVTSHISDKYLPGILIGYISEIEIDANNLTKSGQLTPAVDFAHLKEVLVITTLKQSIE